MNEFIEKIVNNDSIPSPPSVAARLLDLVTQPDASVDEITKVLSADPKLSAKLINYCNSPMVGSKRTISSLQQAVMVLGMRSLRLLSLSFSLMDTQSDSEFNYDDFWRNSLANAIAAKILGNRAGGNGDEQFLLGLVFNVGQIGIGNTYPEKLAEILGDKNALAHLTVELEHQTFGANRYEIGARLLDKWNFPDQMIASLKQFDPENLTPETSPLHLSQLFGTLLLSTDVAESEIQDTKQQAFDLLQLDNDQFDSIFDGLVNEWKSYEGLFNYAAIEINSIQELESRAKESMMQISLGMETEIRQITEEKKELEETALIDCLTSLKNRASFDADLPGLVDYHQRQGKSFGIIVIDIDHFKSVNDTYGHAAGDSVLREVGLCLSEQCRKYDTVYRYGGEEFVALIMDCDFDAITAIANRFRRSIEALSIDNECEVLNVTASLGVCWTDRGEIPSTDTLFKTADAYLYEAKNNGRNRCVIRRCPDSAIAS